jgi:hypothetical protein
MSHRVRPKAQTDFTVLAQNAMARSRRAWGAWLIWSLVCIVAAFSVTFILSSAASILLIIASLATGLLFAAWCFRLPENTERLEALSVWRRGFLFINACMMFSALTAGNLYIILLMAHTALSHDAQTGATVSFKGIDLDLPGRCKHYALFRESPTLFLPRKGCISKVVFDSIAPGSSIAVHGTQSALGFRVKRVESHPVPDLGTR